MHHAIGLSGIVITTQTSGFFGSICQITLITELSTPFVNMRTILAYHKQEKSYLYIFNGIMMTVSFFFLRVCYYYYMIFNQMVIYCLYRRDSFWDLYEPYMYKWCYLSVTLYFFMYALNLYWFSKMLYGLMKALGLTFEEKKEKEKIK